MDQSWQLPRAGQGEMLCPPALCLQALPAPRASQLRGAVWCLVSWTAPNQPLCSCPCSEEHRGGVPIPSAPLLSSLSSASLTIYFSAPSKRAVLRKTSLLYHVSASSTGSPTRSLPPPQPSTGAELPPSSCPSRGCPPAGKQAGLWHLAVHQPGALADSFGAKLLMLLIVKKRCLGVFVLFLLKKPGAASPLCQNQGK